PRAARGNGNRARTRTVARAKAAERDARGRGRRARRDGTRHRRRDRCRRARRDRGCDLDRRRARQTVWTRRRLRADWRRHFRPCIRSRLGDRAGRGDHPERAVPRGSIGARGRLAPDRRARGDRRNIPRHGCKGWSNTDRPPRQNWLRTQRRLDAGGEVRSRGRTRPSVARADRNGPPSVTLEQPDTASRAAVLQPATLAIASLFAFLILVNGISAPFQKDAEPQSAQWIQSIVRDGHWLLPADAYGFTDRKPPLFYWLSALVAKSTGGTVDEVRARAVSVVAGTVLAVAVLAWTVTNVGASEGWLAFLFMLGTYGFASRATEALTDMLLTLLLFTAYCRLATLVDDSQRQARAAPRRTMLAGLILGLAVLAKGPVAIVLCALAASIYMLIERRNPIALMRQRWSWQVVAIAVAVGAVWYVPVAIVGGQKILRIIFAENFGHFMPARLGGTGESYRPFYFIAARLLGGAFPMTLLIIPAALAFYTGEISAAKRRAVLYQVSMSLAVLIFFSIASVKRDDYILPALPGIAILCASVFRLDVRGIAAKLRDVLVAIFVLAPFFVVLLLIFFPDVNPQFKLQSSDAAYYS